MMEEKARSKKTYFRQTTAWAASEDVRSDGGVHFTSKQMKALEEGRGFVRVPLSRHRPKTNGIAERFIRTLKEWLETKVWNLSRTTQIFPAGVPGV